MSNKLLFTILLLSYATLSFQQKGGWTKAWNPAPGYEGDQVVFETLGQYTGQGVTNFSTGKTPIAGEEISQPWKSDSLITTPIGGATSCQTPVQSRTQPFLFILCDNNTVY